MNTAPHPDKPTLLMAEDEEDTASLLKFLLERAGYRIVHAPDGLQAQQLIDTMAPPSLVLLDIMLPHMSGLQLLPYIRNKPDWQRVPIIMLTADSSEHDIQQALATGANDYMVKPFNPRELTARLSRFLKIAA
ncbi:MAG: response regulator [Nitrospira sp.]|nr:response regulator [Nitrospira sp.]